MYGNLRQHLKTALVECAWAASHVKDCYLRKKYESLIGRRGKKRALIAVGHKILIAAYFILKDKQVYKELGAEFLEEKKKNKQAITIINKLKELGYDVDELKKQAACRPVA